MSHPVSDKSERFLLFLLQKSTFENPLSIYFAGSYFIYKIWIYKMICYKWAVCSVGIYWVQGNRSTKSKCLCYVNALVTVISLKHTVPYSEEDCFFISITFWCLLYFNLNLQCWTCVTPFWQSVITQTLQSDYNTTGFATLLFAAICCISIPSHSCNSIWLM